MESIVLSWHQETHCRRLEDIVREEFESSADMKRLIVLFEKPLLHIVTGYSAREEAPLEIAERVWMVRVYRVNDVIG